MDGIEKKSAKKRRRAAARTAAAALAKPLTSADQLARETDILPAGPSPVARAAAGATAASDSPWRRARRAAKLTAKLLLALTLVAATAYGSFFLAYKDKIYPNITADGLNLGGLSPEAAANKIAERTEPFRGNVVAVRHGAQITRIPVNDLNLSYDIQGSVRRAFDFGRRGSWQQQLSEQLSLITKALDYSLYYYDNTKLTPYLLEISESVSTPAENAKLVFADNKPTIRPAQPGGRLDLGALTEIVESRLAAADGSEIVAPAYRLEPVVGTADLAAAADRASTYISAPITLDLGGAEYQTVSRETIVGWLKVNQKSTARFLDTLKVDDIYAASAVTDFALDRAAVAAYVAELAAAKDKAPINASLMMAPEALVVTAPSTNGATLDRDGATTAIMAALAKSAAASRIAKINIAVTKAAVREDNLDTLGIKELISEGVSYFPGSTSARLTNVRVGASKFNGVVLAPGETFSFGALLGTVDASTGYEPELVIIDNHEEKQYGGGLCQVSSTAFRAALLAGLPIVERHSHAFAISYYTEPYGVPGVDATIYYPSVDFKFTNDTGHYILIQTIFEGTTLKFQFYGTKTKTGSIRGPFFVSGNSDATKPSHTVFYRDVLDLTGRVIGTNTFDTYYKSSKDFPIEKQYN